MLRACKGLLRRGGRTAFFTIHAREGLTPQERRRASRDGPVAVATSRPHAVLLASAGFVEVAEFDVTGEFARTTKDWIEQSDEHRHDLAALIGEEAFAVRQAERRAQLAAIADGILCRSLFVARRN